MESTLPSELVLHGAGLSVAALTEAARQRPRIRLSDDAKERIAASRALVDDAVRDGRPLYGVTTGLGARANEALPSETLAQFSYDTLRGRAHAIGVPLPRDTVRAAMIVRLNGFATGAVGVSPAVAKHLAACLTADLTPVIGSIGTIGASDLVLGATMGRALIGEGRLSTPEGERDASEALLTAGIEPPALGPRDGLALANHSSFSAALAATAAHRGVIAYHAAQRAAALSLEVFRANLSAFDADLLNIRPQAGQADAARELSDLLAGSALRQSGEARRLQDPISIRCLPQIHGAARAAFDRLIEDVETEINGASDNPVVLMETGATLSGGGFHTPMLTLSTETAARSLAFMAMAQVARIKAVLTERLTGLSQFLETADGPSNGYAPMLKVAEALAADVSHAGGPTPIWPSLNADGIEDGLTNAALAAQNLERALAALMRLTALELLVGATGFELRAPNSPSPESVTTVREVRRASPAPSADRSISHEVEALAELISRGAFSDAFSGAFSVHA
ncbi:MAG: aromatic amino acid lyase [Pseudomonadota bacterium]